MNSMNSILLIYHVLLIIFIILNISTDEWAQVRGKMKRTTFKEEQKYKNFFISDKDRSMLIELKNVLTLFELVTDEFQSNRVSISRVYPCVDSLKDNLNEKLIESVYTKTLIYNLLESLDKRFGGMVN